MRSQVIRCGLKEAGVLSVGIFVQMSLLTHVHDRNCQYTAVDRILKSVWRGRDIMERFLPERQHLIEVNAINHNRANLHLRFSTL